MDENDIKDEEDVEVESTIGLAHLWFGAKHISAKTFSTFSHGLSIQKISVGQKHCAFLTSHGSLYMYGNNQYGQLGCGNTEDYFQEPVWVEALKNVLIVDVSCGARHTAAVSSTGHVYCWGDSAYGQCGSANQNTQNSNFENEATNQSNQELISPANQNAHDNSIQTEVANQKEQHINGKISSAIDETYENQIQGTAIGRTGHNIISIPVKVEILWDGNQHASQLDKSNSSRRSGFVKSSRRSGGLRSTPSNYSLKEEDGEEENNSKQDIIKPEKCFPVKILSVTCGGRHTVAISEFGELWTWGSGIPLGVNLQEISSRVETPQRIDFLTGRKVLQVACGEMHTLALVQKIPVSSAHMQSSNVSLSGAVRVKPTARRQSSIASLSSERSQSKESVLSKGSNEYQSRESLNKLDISKDSSSSHTMCETCNSPIHKSRKAGIKSTLLENSGEGNYNDSHVCPLGLEVQLQVSSSKGGISSKLGSSFVKQLDSQSLDTDSTCSEADPTAITQYVTAENSPMVETVQFMESARNHNDPFLGENNDKNKSDNKGGMRIPSEDVISEGIVEPGDRNNFKNTSQIKCDNLDDKLSKSDGIVEDDGNISECLVSVSSSQVEEGNEKDETEVDKESKCDMVTSEETVDNNDVEGVKNEGETTMDSTVSVNSIEQNISEINNASEQSNENCDKEVRADSENILNSDDNISQQISNIPDKYMSIPLVIETTTSTITSGSEEVSSSVIPRLENVCLTRTKDGKSKTVVLSTRNSSDSLGGGIPKSKSTFLDEEEAKEFLERQLSGDDMGTATDENTPTSPIAKKVENIMQYVPQIPNTSTAIAMQEYVSSWTKNVVTNIKCSVETTMDRFGIVPGMLGSSMDEDGTGQTSEMSDKDHDIAKLAELTDFQRFGSLPKSSTMDMGKALKSERTHRRKGSLPSGAILTTPVPNIFPQCDVIIDTELWSWGQGSKGQLGHGDLLDRPQPCKVKYFSDKKVVKISAGAKHNVVVTANSQVYSWGCNAQGQLGHEDKSTISSPTHIKLPDNITAWDVSAGDHHTIVLTDAPNFAPQVYYAGKEPGKDVATSEFIHISNLQNVGLIRCLAAGGELCACISDKAGTSHTPVLHELAWSERHFSSQLHWVADDLLKPLLASDSFQSKDSSQLGMALGLLCDAFMCIADMGKSYQNSKRSLKTKIYRSNPDVEIMINDKEPEMSLNHCEMTQVLDQTREILGLQILSKTEQCIGVYQHYSKCFNDVLAIGGFKTCAKLCNSLFEKSKSTIKTVLDLKTYNSREVGQIFLKIMKIPFNRLKDYCKLFGRLALKFPAYTQENKSLDGATQLWEGFKQASTVDITQAENTAQFWTECSTKVTEALKIPTRRLLFDSKVHPLTLQSGGRFSSHRFILFNDIFAHIQGSYHTVYQLATIWLQTANLEHDPVKLQGNFIRLIMPEDILVLIASSPGEKCEWVWAFNQAVDHVLSSQRHGANRSASPRLTPPRDRHASYTFSKHPVFKDTTYEGMWRNGLLFGQGELQWTDGRSFTGAFKDGCQDGYGIYKIPREEGEKEIYEGMWRQGRLCGYGFIKYPSGDSYEGYFRDGKRHGHGLLKQGKLTSSLASIYIGEWCLDKKSGYGVFEDILKGQKYMGLWLDDQKHGNGVIVTIDGMYFEGTFQLNKMTGYGLLMTEDNSCYEGEFSGGPNLAGKGTLTMPNGDYIEGTFNGSFSEGIKVNGTFYKNKSQDTPHHHHSPHGFSHDASLGAVPKSYGRLSVPAHRKWDEIFDHCCGMLGCTKDSVSPNPAKAWEKCAAFIEIGKKMSATTKKSPHIKSKVSSSDIAEVLQKIPEYSCGTLTMEYYDKIKVYLGKAFECTFHPLGKLLENLVDVYRATYVGVGAHPRLLHHAVLEVQSFLDRIYPIVRILFPDLPDGSSLVQIFQENTDLETLSYEDNSADICEVVTPGSLLYPILLPKIYPPLFTLYALYNERADEQYWRRIVSWNKQSDLALMSYLGVDQKFWTFVEEHSVDSPQRLSKIRDKSYIEAVEMLQGISTSFSPADKLYLIQSTFNMINKVVHERLGGEYLWCMDDLFPVFQYVVVRARIQHLGAEIHFMDDLMEPYLEHGELGLMFTTLKACYYQIQNEKIA